MHWLILTIGLLISAPSHAAIDYDLAEILSNMRSLLNPFIVLILAISFMAGIGLMFRGLGMLKAFGMPLTQATRPGEIAGPLVYIVVGAILVYLPTATDIVSETFFQGEQTSIFEGNSVNLGSAGKASTEILGYTSITVEDQWADLIDTIILYVQFIGFIAFVRGWFIVSHAGQPGVQPGSISKGVVHIIAGVLAINFLPLVEILHNTIIG